MFRVRDDRGRELVFVQPPRRVVSLVPSETLTLFDLGLGDRIVGRTRYCTEPSDQVEAIGVCGGTKDVDVERVVELSPDLVLCNQEENAREPCEELALRGLPVFVSFPRRVADGIAHVARLAQIFQVQGEPAVKELMRRAYRLLAPRDAGAAPRPKVFVPIWMDPLISLGGDTFGSDALSLAGADNVLCERKVMYPLESGFAERGSPGGEAGRDKRYPRIDASDVEKLAPDLILLPDEPYSFSEADVETFRAMSTPAAERGAIARCDGKDLFWHGSRSVDGIPRLRALIESL